MQTSDLLVVIGIVSAFSLFGLVLAYASLAETLHNRRKAKTAPRATAQGAPARQLGL